MQVDLYELVNNHLWRTEFGITNWFTPAPAYMHLPNAGRFGNERDWIHYGCQNYYALLNCGFRMRPAAGTASGVHPVPLGFGRVYVHCPNGFSYANWMKGLGEGRSFVTTGPMLLTKVQGDWPGAQFDLKSGRSGKVRVSGIVMSEHRMDAVEVLVNGRIASRITLKPKESRDGAWHARFSDRVTVSGTSWVATRCWEPRDNGRVRFAHTAPTWFNDPESPIAPSRPEIEFLIQRVQDQITANQDVLSREALAEYHEAKAVYESIAARVP
jgi:hypothetical protein